MNSVNRAAPLRVGYDAHALLAPPGALTGKGVQLGNLLGRYAQRFIGFAPPGENNSNLPLVQQGSPRYNIWEQTSLPALLRRTKIDVFLAPYNTAPLYIPSSTRLVLVVHDTILQENFKHGNLRRDLYDGYRRFLIRRAARRAEVILTVSEFSKQEILSYFPGSRVEVIPCTLAASWFNRRAVVPADQRDEYLFMVTSPVPHKNFDRALQAYAKYAASSPHPLKLRIGGMARAGERYRETLTALGVAGLVQFEPRLSDQELQALYRHAGAVLVPSLMEGFGIPMLEAMSVGTPVIASYATSLREVGGDAPYYFDPRNVEEMAAAIKTVSGDAALRQDMASRSLAEAERYHPAVVQAKVDEFWARIANITPEPAINPGMATTAAGDAQF
jgi:glycosyltransferase involved in cell wall biosynthesis